jgi:hypothetical protein
MQRFIGLAFPWNVFGNHNADRTASAGTYIELALDMVLKALVGGQLSPSF